MKSENRYDQVPFVSYPSPERHPRRFMAIAKLFGLDTQSLKKASILEIGCGNGHSLLSMAVSYPGAYFVGVDVGKQNIDDAAKKKKILGLNNIKFVCKDIGDCVFTESFHYILCHGVFSWVRSDVRNSILSCCAKHLDSNGLAYISYNTKPAWNNREVLRQIFSQYDDESLSAHLRIEKVRKLLTELKEHLLDHQTLHTMALVKEIEVLLSQSDGLIFHEFLNPHSDGIYERDFRNSLDGYGLSYIAEAQLGRNLSLRLPELFPSGVASFARLSDDPDLEALLTSLLPIPFRGSLVGLKKQFSGIGLDKGAFRKMYFRSKLSAEVDGKLLPTGMYVNSKKGAVEIDKKEINFLMSVLLEESPRFVSFNSLVSKLEERGIASDALLDVLLDALLHEYLDISLDEPAIDFIGSEFPCAFEFARYESTEQFWVTNLLHEYVPLNEFQRALLPKVDGTKSVYDLEQEAIRLVESGVIGGVSEGTHLFEMDDWQEIIALEARSAIDFFRETALLKAKMSVDIDGSGEAPTNNNKMSLSGLWKKMISSIGRRDD